MGTSQPLITAAVSIVEARDQVKNGSDAAVIGELEPEAQQFWGIIVCTDEMIPYLALLAKRNAHYSKYAGEANMYSAVFKTLRDIEYDLRSRETLH